MAGVLVLDPNARRSNEHDLTDRLVVGLQEAAGVASCRRLSGRDPGYQEVVRAADGETLISLPRMDGQTLAIPDLSDARTVFECCAGSALGHLIVLSHAAVYGSRPQNPGMMMESRPRPVRDPNLITRTWAAYEELAEQYATAKPGLVLTILRPVTIPGETGHGYLNRVFRRRVAFTYPGHDPCIQLLSPEDLIRAIRCVVVRRAGGVYNVAPDDVIPLRVALRLAGTRRIPIPRSVQRPVRAVLSRLGLADPIDQVEYLRFAWTVSNRKIKHESGFTPERSSAEALAGGMDGRPDDRRSVPQGQGQPLRFDDYGMDRAYIERCRRLAFRYLYRYYWRVEVKGADYIPRQGRGVLTGVHRGFMPFDGVIMLHLIITETGRVPRFLIHPALVRHPFPFNFTKLGGLHACGQNGDYVLEQDELLGFYPEGIQGAFTMYRRAYRLGKFGGNQYVKIALRNRAPIIPFVTVGNAEIFPILGRINWSWWQQATLWPFFPIAPPFPLLPVPLPSRWHIQFLEPVHVEQQYPPEAAHDPDIVQRINRDIKARMQTAIDEMLRQRKHIFFGSIFDER